MSILIETLNGSIQHLKDIFHISLIIDIRSQLKYEISHLTGAYSLSLPDMLVKRFISKHKDLSFTTNSLIMDDDNPLKKRLKYNNIIFYNQDGTKDDLLLMYLHVLTKEDLPVSYVIGGFNAIVLNGQYTLQSNGAPHPSVIQHVSEYIDTTVDYNYVTDSLAIGAEGVAHNRSLIKSESFTHILNVSSNNCVIYDNITCLWKNISDSIKQTIFTVLPECVTFIDTALRQGGKVFVHCMAGISRSVTMVMAYYMWAHKMTCMDAYGFIQARRAKASPNLSFMGQLITIERYLKQTNYNLIESCRLAAVELNMI